MQAFGNVLGFDWHSSGVTTVAMGARKDGLGPRAGELGLFLRPLAARGAARP